MDQLDLNDMRAVLGAIHNQGKDLVEKVDDIGAQTAATAALCRRLDHAVADFEAIVGAIPDGFRKLSSDPMLGPFIGPQLEEMASDLDAELAARRAIRSTPPAVESAPE